MKNRTNIIKYRIWAPVYDLLFGDEKIKQSRKRAFALLDVQPGQKVLLVGIGTGQDLYYVPQQVEVVGIDLSAAMLAKAQFKIEHITAHLMIMNAEELTFPDNHFDAVIMNLILSVVEHPRAAMREAVRVLKPGSKIIVFDKFLSHGVKPSWLRRLVNIFTSWTGTDIIRTFEDISQGLNITTLRREESIFGGDYQIVLLEKIS